MKKKKKKSPHVEFVIPADYGWKIKESQKIDK